MIYIFALEAMLSDVLYLLTKVKLLNDKSPQNLERGVVPPDSVM